MPQQDEQSCENCKFWERREATHGACLRYPPVAEVREGSINWTFPLVKPENWCGEWVTKIQPSSQFYL